jgi:rhodanese-related sulfurtransferase
MDWTSILLAVAAGLGLGWLLMRSNSVDYTKIHIINPTDFKNNMRKGQLVDLRKADAYEQDRIKGARNYRPKQITSKYTKLRTDQSVYLYCQNGKRSKKVAKKLAKLPFPDIYILDGGFDALQ